MGLTKGMQGADMLQNLPECTRGALSPYHPTLSRYHATPLPRYLATRLPPLFPPLAAPDFSFTFTAVTTSLGVKFKQASGIWTELMPLIEGRIEPNNVITMNFATVGRPTMVKFINTTENQQDGWVLNALCMEVDGQTTEIVEPTWRRWWVKTEQPELPIPAA